MTGKIMFFAGAKNPARAYFEDSVSVPDTRPIVAGPGGSLTPFSGGKDPVPRHLLPFGGRLPPSYGRSIYPRSEIDYSDVLW